jgi:UDP-N-acetylmuramoyl-tripeptide--D-alanyl-D-alanine ligase
MTARWGDIKAAEVVASVGGDLLRGSGEKGFKSLGTDTRNMAEGCLFWALKGERFDGHDFVSQAVEKGAAGAVVRRGFDPGISPERDVVLIAVPDTLTALGDMASWWRHQYRCPVVGITGSAGKTTTKEMAAAILGRKGRTLKSRGNFNNLIGLPLTLLLLDQGHRYVILEMGMNRAGEIGRLTDIADPDVGLITNIARAHLEGVGSLEGVARAKGELLERMSPEAVAVLNGDDPVLMKAASAFQRRVITFGRDPGNDVRAEQIRSLGREGITFHIRDDSGSFPVRLKVTGFQNVFNALAAAAIARCLGASVEDVAEGLSTFTGMQGRFVITLLSGGIMLVDDTYNSNPFSLKAAMDSMKALAGRGRVIVGLGEMFELGAETLNAHQEAGAMVAELKAHYFVALGEHAGVMIQGAVEKGFPEEKAVVARDHREMEERIRGAMKQGDFIFLKGSRRAGLDKVAEGLKAGL